jgi:formylglycine-generating enzyme required for sulfatase activity
MKKVLVFAFLAALAAGVYAQQVVVAIGPFEAKAGISAEDANIIAEVYRIRLSATRAVRVVTREDLDNVVREQRFQTSDWSDDSKTAALGNALNAHWIVRGTLQPVVNRIIVTISILDIKTLEVKGGADVRVSSIDDAYDQMDDLVAQTVSAMTGQTPDRERDGGRGGGTPVRPDPGTVPEGFVRVEGGTFQMGSSNGENDERPVHTVTVRSFSMGRHEVTQKEWTEVMGTTVRQQRDQAGGNSLYGEGDNYPMYYVSWYEAVEYCNKRSIREGLTQAYRGSGTSIICDFTASGYRLPTEAEWEYAARGGNKDYLTYEYAGGNSAGAVGWYDGNSGGSTHPAGQKQPNSLGLYDMSGNVWEWCWDWYSNSYSSGSQTDPGGPVSGASRVLRGGSWGNSAADLRSSYRNFNTPGGRGSGLGFRLVRP